MKSVHWRFLMETFLAFFKTTYFKNIRKKSSELSIQMPLLEYYDFDFEELLHNI